MSIKRKQKFYDFDQMLNSYDMNITRENCETTVEKTEETVENIEDEPKQMYQDTSITPRSTIEEKYRS